MSLPDPRRRITTSRRAHGRGLRMLLASVRRLASRGRHRISAFLLLLYGKCLTNFTKPFLWIPQLDTAPRVESIPLVWPRKNAKGAARQFSGFHKLQARHDLNLHAYEYDSTKHDFCYGCCTVFSKTRFPGHANECRD